MGDYSAVDGKSRMWHVSGAGTASLRKSAVAERSYRWHRRKVGCGVALAANPAQVESLAVTFAIVAELVSHAAEKKTEGVCVK